jgi:hypothetical protein
VADMNTKICYLKRLVCSCSTEFELQNATMWPTYSCAVRFWKG